MKKRITLADIGRKLNEKPKSQSQGEEEFSSQLSLMRIPFSREYKFHPKRQWRADFKIEGYPILVEIEGGVHSNGRHTRGKGFEGDCEKYNQANLLGYHVLRGSTSQVKSGMLLDHVVKMMEVLKQ